MSVESLYRVRVDFHVPIMKEAKEREFWSGIFNADEVEGADILEGCEANMYVSAIFLTPEEAAKFDSFIHRYLNDNNATILT